MKYSIMQIKCTTHTCTLNTIKINSNLQTKVICMFNETPMVPGSAANNNDKNVQMGNMETMILQSKSYGIIIVT